MFQLLRISYHSANGLNKQRCVQRSGLRREGLTYKDAITEVVAPDWCLRGGETLKVTDPELYLFGEGLWINFPGVGEL